MIIKNCNIIDCTGRAPYKATVKVTKRVNNRYHYRLCEHN